MTTSALERCIWCPTGQIETGKVTQIAPAEESSRPFGGDFRIHEFAETHSHFDLLIRPLEDNFLGKTAPVWRTTWISCT